MRPSGPGGVTMTMSRHAGDHGRDRRHHRDRGKGALAARHVAGDRRDRPEALAGEGAGADLLHPHLLGLLVLVEAADAVGGDTRSPRRTSGSTASSAAVEVGRRGGDGVGLDRRLVELAREARERLVALGPHRGDDRLHLLDDGPDRPRCARAGGRVFRSQRRKVVETHLTDLALTLPRCRALGWRRQSRSNPPAGQRPSAMVNPGPPTRRRARRYAVAALILLGSAGGSVAAFRWAQHWFAIDACLDFGGRWDCVHDRCDSPQEDCLNAGGQWDYASHIGSPTTAQFQ